MKTFLIITTLLILFNACSYDNAFSSFDITPKQAQSENSILSSKIQNKSQVNGIISVVYLNDVLPKEYRDSEYFYVSLYTKDKTEVSFLLNDTQPLSIENLPAKNKFSTLTSFSPEWQKYYLVHFAEQGKSLAFMAKNSTFSSEKMLFKKY